MKRTIGVFLGFDVRIKGGLTSMMTAVLAAHDLLGIESRCMMPSLQVSERGIGTLSVVEGGRTWVAGKRLARLPNFASALATSAQLWRVSKDFDQVTSVVGGGSWALPSLAAPRTLMWVATPFEEELRSRIRADSAARRLGVEALVQLENRAEGEALRRVDRVLALSNKTRALLCERHEIDESTMGRLYAPVDNTRFVPGAKARPPTCVFTARLDDERKDVDVLCRAWAHVVKERKDARLTLIGPAEPGGRARAAAARAGVEDTVAFAGFQKSNEVSELLQRASLFVLPSKQEGLGIVALEAMACGTPVVALSNGGTDELIAQSGAGEVLGDRDPRAFAEAIVRALDAPDLAAQREAAIDFVDREATPEVFATRLDEEYRAL